MAKEEGPHWDAIRQVYVFRPVLVDPDTGAVTNPNVVICAPTRGQVWREHANMVAAGQVQWLRDH